MITSHDIKNYLNYSDGGLHKESTNTKESNKRINDKPADKNNDKLQTTLDITQKINVINVHMINLKVKCTHDVLCTKDMFEEPGLCQLGTNIATR